MADQINSGRDEELRDRTRVDDEVRGGIDESDDFEDDEEDLDADEDEENTTF